MRNCLIITDLHYLDCLEKSEIMGGYVFTAADTNAGFGSANAVGAAFAYGQQTYTDTRITVSTQNYSNASFSYANASATAFAQNSYREQSTYRSTSIHYLGY